MLDVFLIFQFFNNFIEYISDIIIDAGLDEIIFIVIILLSVAFFTLVERKALGTVQRRRGPNFTEVSGIFGLLQPISDGVKLFSKEVILPSNADDNIFLFAPYYSFTISLMGWGVIPFSDTYYDTFSLNCFYIEDLVSISDFSLSSLLLLTFSALGIYGILIAGWSSNSKYSLLGTLRSTAQMVAYELSISLILLSIVITVSSLNLNSIIFFQKNSISFIFLYPILFVLFIICIVAETNRHPFDLPEAEAELVAGYATEFSAFSFAFFSLAEYSNMLLMSYFTIILFWSATPYFLVALKLVFFILLYSLLRAILPRYRYDQLMLLGWKVFLPIALSFLFLNYFYFYFFC